WFAVEHAAIVVAEGGNLLMLDGYAADQADWAEYAQGLTRAALKARDAAEQQDADALFAAGGEVYSVCRACHNRYMINAADE
ncbi:MAG: cytochrome c, partial [Pseudomonadota bacterium]